MIESIVKTVSARILRRYETDHTGVSVPEIVRWTVDALDELVGDVSPWGYGAVERALSNLPCECLRSEQCCVTLTAKCEKCDALNAIRALKLAARNREARLETVSSRLCRVEGELVAERERSTAGNALRRRPDRQP